MPDHVLAFLELIEEAPGGIRSPMRIDIGYPLRNPDGTWTCDVSVGGRNEHHKVLLGADAFQSICLAIRFAKITLKLTAERGIRLLDSDELLDIDLNCLFGGL